MHEFCPSGVTCGDAASGGEAPARAPYGPGPAEKFAQGLFVVLGTQGGGVGSPCGVYVAPLDAS